jgi:hypothetical protein
MSIKTADMDQKIIQWEEAIDKDPVLRNDPVLLQAVVEFKRHKQINDKLWNEMEGNETIEDPKTGRMIANPVIAMYIKNQTSFLKTARQRSMSRLPLTRPRAAWKAFRISPSPSRNM